MPILTALLLASAFAGGPPLARLEKTSVSAAAPKLSVYFLENLGQVHPDEVSYYLAQGNLQVGLTDNGVLVRLLGREAASSAEPVLPARPGGPRESPLRVHFEGALRVVPQGLDPLPHPTHYLLGAAPAGWRTGVRGFQRVVYEGLYPGIDLSYRATPEGLKSEFLVQPGADPSQIRVRYEGAIGAAIDSAGGLAVSTRLGQLYENPPFSYQGTREVACPFVLRGEASYGFRCGSWDPTAPLVIDPLLYATYLGGGLVGGPNDFGNSIAVDVSGNAYVAGEVESVDFPVTAGAFDTSLAGATDVFVAKLNPTGSGLVYATYLGGSGGDFGGYLTIDASGNAYVTGATESSDFPTTPGAYDASYNGGSLDAFMAELNAAGNGLLYSTYLGGGAGAFIGLGGVDAGTSIRLGPSGTVYVGGYTDAQDFPTTPLAYDITYNGGTFDGFLVKINSAGLMALDLVYGTFLGGSGFDRVLGVAVDASGDAYLTGDNQGSGFPSTVGAFDPLYNGGFSDAFAAKITPAGTVLADLVYATFLGGTSAGADAGWAIALDTSGNAYVAGLTLSGDYPTTAGAYDMSANGMYDAFVTAVSASGASLVYSTYLGSSGDDFALGIAVDSAANAFVTGDAGAGDFPLTAGAVDTTISGLADAFAAELSPSGALLYSTALGGAFHDAGRGIAVDTSGAIYVAGFTTSTDFPATAGSFDPTHNLSYDAFAAKIGLPPSGGTPCRTVGFWKNHPSAWPVTTLILGTVTYTQSQLLLILQTPPQKDASLILAHQLIAAKLNVAGGSNPAAVSSTIAAADTFLGSFTGSLPYGVKPSSPSGQQAVSLAEILDDYNNNRLSPAC